MSRYETRGTCSQVCKNTNNQIRQNDSEWPKSRKARRKRFVHLSAAIENASGFVSAPAIHGFRTLTSQTGPALIALYSIVGLQLPIASHSILQSINVHCIFTHILLYYYIQIIQFIPYQPFHSFPHLAPSSYVVVEVEEASHRLHGSVWLYKWFKNSFPPRKCV